MEEKLRKFEEESERRGKEMAEQEQRLRDMNDEMENYKRQQEELEEQRRAADELRRQYEESAHMAQEEKDRLAQQYADAQEEIQRSMATLEEKESEMNVMQSSLEQAQKDREEKEQALIEAMNAIHVRETEHEENTVEEVNHEYSEHVQSSVDTMHSVEMTFENDYEENTIEEMNHEYSADLASYEQVDDLPRPEEERLTEAEKNDRMKAQLKCSDRHCLRKHISVQTRKIHCTNPMDGSHVNDSLCKELSKNPVVKQECVNENCTTRWNVSSWSECMGECEKKGSVVRMITCIWTNSGLPAGQFCNHLPQPNTRKPCQMPKCKPSTKKTYSFPIIQPLKKLYYLSTPMNTPYDV
ncbi:Hypothetical predicted protein [Mytilus galloprovincialis]|nr:Hypothetical predicted protein [Mytilus galloprovincialis]